MATQSGGFNPTLDISIIFRCLKMVSLNYRLYYDRITLEEINEAIYKVKSEAGHIMIDL